MRLLMGLQEFFETDTRVDLRGVELGVPEDFLNGSDVRTGVVHESGHGVAEDVASAGFVDAGGFDVATAVFG